MLIYTTWLIIFGLFECFIFSIDVHNALVCQCVRDRVCLAFHMLIQFVHVYVCVGVFVCILALPVKLLVSVNSSIPSLPAPKNKVEVHAKML